MPSVLVVGGTHDSVTDDVAAGETVTVKGASEVEAVPSLAVMTMPVKVPVPPGVPYSVPLDVSKLAHDGRFVMLNINGLPSASEAVGLNEYGCPTDAVVTGVPLMTGARFVGSTVEPDLTAIEKAGRDTVVVPSDTAMTMLE